MKSCCLPIYIRSRGNIFGCRATITAQYEDGDVPVVRCLRSVDNHVLRSTGARHIVCPSANLIVDCKEEIVRKIKENPERPVMQIYEEVYTRFIRRLDEQGTESDSFVQGMPSAESFERTMYRARREVIPANPSTQNEIHTGNGSEIITYIQC